MKIRFTNEAKTGAVVLVAVAALTVLVLKVGNFQLLQKGYTVKSQFHFTAGVKKHSPVRLSGVDVGEVKDIRVIYGEDTIVEVDIWLRDGVRLRSDSICYVTTLGLMGEKYIEIKAGTKNAPYAQEGDLVKGIDPMRLEDLMEMATKIGDQVGTMAEDISRLANNVDRAVQDNRPKIDQIFTNLDETSENFREFSQDIRWHPWKILAKGKERSPEEMERERQKRLAARGIVPAESVPAETAPKRSNFGPAKAA